MKGLDGIQGPVYVGTGCVFFRQALYGYGPPAAAAAALSAASSRCCCRLWCRPAKKDPRDLKEINRDSLREDLSSAIFNLREIDSKLSSSASSS